METQFYKCCICGDTHRDGQYCPSSQRDPGDESLMRAPVAIGICDMPRVIAPIPPMPPAKRVFATGAVRDTDEGKMDYEGFLSVLSLEAYAAYMDVNTVMADGTRRNSDNWQKGIPIETYRKSWFRHMFDAWKQWRGLGSDTDEGELGALCGSLFNNFGIIHERMKADPEWFGRELAKYKRYRERELERRRQRQ